MAADERDAKVGTGYVLGQLARALKTSEEHGDPEVRERARAKIDRWIRVIKGMLLGLLRTGSRTPVAGTPAWATLEVVTGGFATGGLRAEGALRPHEVERLRELSLPEGGAARAALNAFSLGEQGMAELRDRLRSGCYRIGVPEEGALLVVAWLVEHGHADRARALLDEIGPFFSRLRFYPIPDPRPLRAAARGDRFDGTGCWRGPEGEARRFLGWSTGKHWLFA